LKGAFIKSTLSVQIGVFAALTKAK
jgi:hypothetical protein